jgi:hypothetical protein
MDEIERLKQNDKLVKDMVSAYMDLLGSMRSELAMKYPRMTNAFGRLATEYTPTPIKYGITVVWRPLHGHRSQTVTLDFDTKEEAWDAYEQFARNVRRRMDSLMWHYEIGPMGADVYVREEYTPMQYKGPLYTSRLRAGF